MNQVSSFLFVKNNDLSQIQFLKTHWRENLLAPQDDMWEAFMDMSVQWEIRLNKEIIGYACVNDENILLQFYLLPYWLNHTEKLFEQFIKQQDIKKAILGTNNPVPLTSAMHFQKAIKVHTSLFTDLVRLDKVEKKEGLTLAQTEDLDQLVGFCFESTGAPKEWSRGYFKNLIAKQELFILKDQAEILGTCEVRKSIYDKKVAHIGMIVSSKYRRKGLGTYLLGIAKEIAIDWKRHPVCSCEIDNLGSLKSIQNNGFRSKYQILSMEF